MRERARNLSLTIAHNSLRDQHVVESHELWVRGILILHIPKAENGPLFDFAEHGKKCGFHPVAIQSVLSSLNGEANQWAIVNSLFTVNA